MSFSDEIRAAAGRGSQPLEPVVPVERPVGDLGAGRGGASEPLPRARAMGHAEVNARIRQAAQLARSLTVAGGVVPGNLDDVFGR